MISIVIPLYNKEKYIEETLQSLKDLRNIEILVVENQSTDHSREILENCMKNDDRIRLIEGQPDGVSNARNRGLSAATGEYVYFLDADDRIDAKSFSKVQVAIEERKMDIGIFGFEKFDDAKGVTVSSHLLQTGDIYPAQEEWAPLMDRMVDSLLAYNVSNKIYRRALLIENGIRFQTDMDRLEDLSFFVQALDRAQDISYIDDPVHAYRVNVPGSLVHRKRSDYDFLLKAARFLGECRYVSMHALLMVMTRELSDMRLELSFVEYSRYTKQVREIIDRVEKEKTAAKVAGSLKVKYFLGTRMARVLYLWAFLRYRCFRKE